jgi:type IV pilus assembly protein PilF
VKHYVLVALLALVISGCSSQPNKTQRVEAPAVANATQDPAAVYVELATTYLRQGSPTAALANAEKALAIDPNRKEVRLIQAMAKSALGQNAEAERLMRQYLQAVPNDPYAVNALGTLLCRQNRHADALREFDKAAASPQNTTPWVAMTNGALCELERGARVSAENRLQQALQANPQFAPALLASARVHLNNREHKAARGYLQRYFSVAPPSAESLSMAYRVETTLGNHQSAVTYYNLLKTRFPQSPQTLRLLAP